MSGSKAWWALLAAVCFGLAGCSSTPVRFYSLDGVTPARADAHSEISVVVAQVGIPPRVDRRQLVLGVGEVKIAELEQWVAPLREEIGHAVALNLSHLLGAEQVAAWPQNLVADAALSVHLDVARFDSQPGVGAMDEISWSVRDRQGKPLASGRKNYQSVPANVSLAALVAAHNQNLAAVAEDIAQAVVALKQ
ncbi:PqiC family protein [Uliginosibacterium gangwonense]|uniref:PqiC family protein n=1 Tax=Uliginosibacterium gangwonense TaxID=392736 RepID=UPI00039FE1D3|nr:PqiC family protein [Uliginosibacterium gangwonense]